jgi:nicotinate-nucleotide adenylyltransferase
MHGKQGKTALFFGSFDPVHIGHLIIAEYFLNLGDIAEVWFVITPQNPFKIDQQLTGQLVRKEMLELAIEGTPNFCISDIEFELSQPNYTWKTLLELKERYPRKDFVLLIGGDNLASFDKWKNHNEILSLLPVYVYPRLGFESNAFDHFPGLKKTQAPIVEISASQIRKNLAEGLSTRFLLPPKVYDYIVKNRIYFNPNSFFTTST